MFSRLAGIFGLCISVSVSAQDTVPHLSGHVTLSVARGTFQCDLTLSNLPAIKDYYIRLNSGMNIRYIRNAEGTASLRYDKASDDSMSTGESSAYFIKGGSSRKYLPKAVEITYVGMYPVIADTSSAEDWKGNIAFNGKTVRTDGSQSAWYPILYDIKQDKAYPKVTYDLDIDCADCKVIYINGNPPVNGTHARLKSDAAQELTMFSGDYQSVAINGNYFLNTGIDESSLASFEKTLHSFKDYYEKNIGIPYRGGATYIQTTPVSKNNAWLFATYPTIVTIGFGEYGMKSFVDEQKRRGFEPYMAHELGHYYFGTVRNFNAALGDMLSEGFAEYLSLSATRNLISDSIYRAKMSGKMRALRDFHGTPFASVRSQNDYADRELYVYYYAPVIFSAIEKEIGQQAMWAWIRTILETPAAFADYTFLSGTLASALHDPEKAKMISAKYFASSDALKNADAALGISSEGQSTAASVEQKEPKTYYYFFLASPFLDEGTSQNRTVTYSEIAQVTATPAELSRLSKEKFPRLLEACENDGGCSSNFNTYPSLEQARFALQRWLKRYAGNPRFVVKAVNL